MKHRWIPAALGAATLVLAACAPQQGGDVSSDPTDVPSSAAAAPSQAGPSSSAAPTPTVAAGESSTPLPTPDDYEY